MRNPLAVLLEHPRNASARAGVLAGLRAGINLTILTRDPAKYADVARGVMSSLPGALTLAEIDTLSDRALTEYLERTSRRPDAILSFSHHFCPAAARLARRFGCRSSNPVAVEAAVQKDKMRRVLARRPGSVDHAVVRSADQMVDALRRFGGQAVAKPAAETSSLGVELVTDETSARAAFQKLNRRRVNRQGQAQDGRVLVEEVITGPEFSVELFLTGGRVEVYGVTAKTPHSGCPFVEQADSFPYAEDPDVVRALSSAASDAVTALGLTEGPAHVELRYSADGPRIIEINPRQPGGHLPTLIEMVLGRNIFLDTMCRALGLAVAPARQGAASAATWWQIYAERNGVVGSFDGIEALRDDPRVAVASLHIRPGQHVNRVRSNLDCIGSLVVTGATTSDSLMTAAALAERVRIFML